ncbi:MAG: excinuclease ABC subunit UvrC [Thaumarchaeota archaeon]|nr:excinuclease ABC subunit UvrC [Nitrososphaerota archaeon]
MIFNINNIKQIPQHTGIYIMKNESSDILYIGKAKNLRNRIRSYLNNQDVKTRKLLNEVYDIIFILTNNEKEAFLLESNMIKQYRPRFNIELKDQQKYTYLMITNEKFPRLSVARRSKDGKFIGKGKVYGPITVGSSKTLTIGKLRKIFKIRICKNLPSKACLEYHIGNCDAPCEFKSAQIEYNKNVQELEKILADKNELTNFRNKLEIKMMQCANLLKFEESLEIKKTLALIDELNTEQSIEHVNYYDEEYFGLKIDKQIVYIMTFRQKYGVIRDNKRFSFDLICDNTFSNFLYQYYSTSEIPNVIISNELPSNVKLLELLFSEKSNKQVKIITPLNIRQKNLMKLIMKNINQHMSILSPGTLELKQMLKMLNEPKIIECFDVSNYGNEYAVGSMSRFVDGYPDTSNYKKFRIKTIYGVNDFAMIYEIVKRRYCKINQKLMPDLILIDGGKGQLRMAEKALRELKFDTPCISIAKKKEKVFMRNETIIMPKNNLGLMILQHARDEAHRFAINYNKTIRKKYLSKSHHDHFVFLK